MKRVAEYGSSPGSGFCFLVTTRVTFRCQENHHPDTFSGPDWQIENVRTSDSAVSLRPSIMQVYRRTTKHKRLSQRPCWSDLAFGRPSTKRHQGRLLQRRSSITWLTAFIRSNNSVQSNDSAAPFLLQYSRTASENKSHSASGGTLLAMPGAALAVGYRML